MLVEILMALLCAALLLAAVCYAAREKAPLCAMRESDRRKLAVMAAVGVALGGLREMSLTALCANQQEFTFAASSAAVSAELLLAGEC